MKNLRDIAGHLVGCTYWQFYQFYWSWQFHQWFKSMGWRNGQAAVNLASLCQPSLARNISAEKSWDPFNDNTKLPEFFQWLEANWPGREHDQVPS